MLLCDSYVLTAVIHRVKFENSLRQVRTAATIDFHHDFPVRITRAYYLIIFAPPRVSLGTIFS